MKDMPDAGLYDKHLKPFGATTKNVDFGSKYVTKYSNNPAPGIYDTSINHTLPRNSSALINTGQAARSKFTESPTRGNPDGGVYSGHIKKFGATTKKIGFGSKYKTKYNNNPAPGIYDPSSKLTLPNSRSALIKTGDAARSKFTESPTRGNPDGGVYSGHIKTFGATTKKIGFGSKYKTKYNKNPAPGIYDPRNTQTLPKTTSAVINPGNSSRSKFTESPTR